MVDGRRGDDRLYAAGSLVGGAGDDDLVDVDARTDDVLDGGPGADVANHGGTFPPVTVDLVAGTATGNGIGSDTLTGIENVFGSESADRLSGDAVPNLLTSGPGADRLDGAGGTDTCQDADPDTRFDSCEA